MRTSQVVVEQTVQTWGNGLGIRITAPLAKAAHISCGTTVKVEVVEEGFLVRISGKPKQTLAQKLKAFDPNRHGGEVASSGRIGEEVF